LPIVALTRLYRTLRTLTAASMAIIGAACASTQIESLSGAARPPIRASDVIVYFAPPANCQQIALLSATNKTFFHVGGQKAIDELVGRLAAEAAKLGANGIIVDEIFDEQAMSLGTGAGTESYTHNADISLSVGARFGVYKKTANARAIYVPRE
jgi:hypothetical protein